MFHHALEAALDADGSIRRLAPSPGGPVHPKGSPFEGMVKDGIDGLSVEGAANLPYAIPNLQVDLHTPEDIAVPVLWWRSVGSTHTAYSTETFLDQAGRGHGQGPGGPAPELLGKHPRHAAVLRLAADKAGWGTPLAPGKAGERRGRGVAVHESFHSFVAQVAEVTVAADGSVKVDRVVCAVDCGIAINPDNVRAQVEGSVGFALSAALHGEITLKDGVVSRATSASTPPIRINEMPKGGGAHRRLRPKNRPASASPACRRWRRPWPTPSGAPRTRPAIHRQRTRPHLAGDESLLAAVADANAGSRRQRGSAPQPGTESGLEALAAGQLGKRRAGLSLSARRKHRPRRRGSCGRP
jgi:CO/xanthine dehydrogenase Mo-binding subunit